MFFVIYFRFDVLYTQPKNATDLLQVVNFTGLLIVTCQQVAIIVNFIKLQQVNEIPSKGVNWDTWCELGQNRVNRQRCDCR